MVKPEHTNIILPHIYRLGNPLFNGVMDSTEIRRANFRALVEKEDKGVITSAANRLGRSQAQISHLIGSNPTKGIGKRLARVIEEAYGKPYGWLDVRHDPEIDVKPLVEDAVGRAFDPSRYSFVAKMDAPFHGGPGGQAPEVEEVEDHLAFRTDWLRGKGYRAEDLVIVPVRGNSMAPLIQAGDIVLVNRGAQEIESGRIYAINYDDDLRVKRLYRELDGSITISSDNKSDPSNRDENVPRTKLEEALMLRIIGRVVWAGGDL
jgi:phage repressor protein C with HTH and peptisase S24 domain